MAHLFDSRLLTSWFSIYTDQFFDLYWWLANTDSSILNKNMDKSLKDYNSDVCQSFLFEDLETISIERRHFS